MNVAHSRLRAEDVTVAKLADELGYRSEAAFNRAFTRIVGCTPGSVRTPVSPGADADDASSIAAR